MMKADQCGYFELMEPPIGSYFVWDHRGPKLGGVSGRTVKKHVNDTCYKVR